jgi:hypothetical protein
LNKNALNLPINGTETLIAATAPANAANKGVTWATNNSAIATVSAAGLVTAKAPGTAVITVRTDEGGFTTACAVTVAGAGSISVGFTDLGAGAFSQESFVIAKSGSPASQTIALAGTWATVEWRVDGVPQGNGASLTINAADYAVGGHTLLVTVRKDSVPWTKKLSFTVSN